MVIIVESLCAEFGSRIWEYIKLAGYGQRFKSTGTPEYYRFINPKTSEYPAMIEIFSRRIEGITLPSDAVLTPLPIDDEVSSLSAILLDDDYYDFLRTGVKVVENIPVAGAAHMIPLKIKAWIDLTERKTQGRQIDSKSIRKHKNDILRLATLLSPDFRLSLPDPIASDMERFLAMVDGPERFIRVAAAYGL